MQSTSPPTSRRAAASNSPFGSLTAVAVVLALALGFVAWSPVRLAGASPAHSPAPTLPSAGAGPYAVGHQVVNLSPTATRPALHVDVWYPSHRSTAPKASYQIIPGVDIPARLAVEGATPLGGRYPLVLYSHGAGAFSVIATYFTEVLASYGYVVAAPDHPGDTIIDAALNQDNGTEAERVTNRVSDLRRVITAFTTRSPAIAPTLARMVEPKEIVATGHSLGGAGVLALAAADHRVREVIAMDPTADTLRAAQLAEVRVPVLYLMSPVGADQIGEATLFRLRGPWYQVYVPTATHLLFTDLCSYQPLFPTWIAAIDKADPSINAAAELTGTFDVPANCNPPTMNSDRFHDLVDGYSLAFLNLTVRHQTKWKKPLLAPQPGAAVFERTTTHPPGTRTTTGPTQPAP
jgi:predicted dienelactone hydrolase